MSLATRCPACQTAFRVVQDQLKISDGWVRCGRCNHVFNALEGLFDLDRGAVPASAAPQSTPRTSALPPAPIPVPAEPPATAAEPAEASTGTAPTTPTTPTTPADPEPPSHDAASSFQSVAPEPPDDDEDIPGFTAADVLDSRFFKSDLYGEPMSGGDAYADARFVQEVADDERAEPSLSFDDAEIGDAEREAAMEAAAARRAELRERQTAAGAGSDARRAEKRRRRDRRHDSDRRQSQELTPSFVRRAERARRWQHPTVRAGLALATVLLSLTLVAQASIAFAGTLAARWPSAKPWLSDLCRLAGCSVEAPRRIQDLSIESASFTKTEGAENYRLALVLRNRGALTLAMPAIELTLIDLRETIVARRMLYPADFRAPEALAAGQEQTLAVTIAADALQSQGLRVAGYRVWAFYP